MFVAFTVTAAPLSDTLAEDKKRTYGASHVLDHYLKIQDDLPMIPSKEWTNTSPKERVFGIANSFIVPGEAPSNATI